MQMLQLQEVSVDFSQFRASPVSSLLGVYFHFFGYISAQNGLIFIPQKATGRGKCSLYAHIALKHPLAFI